MFHEMRRKRQLLTSGECEDILNKGTSGVLALYGSNGYPYAVPLSYVYSDGWIYFHSAITGHKIDAIKFCPKASFCVTGSDNVVPGEYTTYFSSVIVFGGIHILDNKEEKMEAIKKLAVKYAASTSEKDMLSVINKEWEHFCITGLLIEHMSGKKAKELIK